VIEVDVGQQEGAGALVPQGLEQHRQARAGTRVDEHVANLPGADDARAPKVHEIDEAHEKRR
jgi:hypothetical protein